MNLQIQTDIRHDMNTLELARVYENQGYIEQAYQIYAALDALDSTGETRDGLGRTGHFQTMSKAQNTFQTTGEKKVRAMIAEWFALIAAKHRLDRIKKMNFTGLADNQEK